jgi:thioredoxin reductase (NADPH)
MADTIENVVIIGGGPAGLAAGLYTARAGLNPLILAGSPAGGQLMLTSDVENYLGYQSILGPELIAKMREHAIHFGTRIKDENVLSVDFSKAPHTLKTLDGEVKAKTVIIATGSRALWLELPSEKRLRGRGVSACATCDGFFFKNKIVAVVGGGDTAMEEALTLAKFASKVYLLHRKDVFRASPIMQNRAKAEPKIEIMMNTGVEEVLGEQKVEGIKVKTTVEGKETLSEIKLDGLFIAIGHVPDTKVVEGSLLLDKKGYIVTHNRAGLDWVSHGTPVDETLLKKAQAEPGVFPSATSVEGVFAAGDCVDFIHRQAATAMGMGVAAALDAQRYLEMHE